MTAPTEPTESPEPLARSQYRTRLEWIDTDAAGIYHNATVSRFVEAAEAALMRERGLPGYFPVAPRARFEVSFEAPLHFGQQVTASVAVVRIGTSSMTFDFEVWGESFEGRPRKRAASGRYVTVHVAGAHADGSARSAPWPREWVVALGGHP